MSLFNKKLKTSQQQYGENFWNNKWPKAPIIYSGRALRGQSNRIGIDVKTFIVNNDEILKQIIKRYNLKRSSLNETAWEVQRFVCRFLTYKYDDETAKIPEFWQFPFETIAASVGDCEDGAILIASLCINAGIPSWRIKVAAGYVQASPTAPQGGHGYCIYLADRPESNRKKEWVILDWCYYEDSTVHPSNKPLAKNGGYNNCYKDTWFSFNDQHSWNQQNLMIGKGRISDHQTKKLEEVTETINLESIMEAIDKKIK